MNQPEFKERHATRAKNRGKHALIKLSFGFGFPFDWLKKNGSFDVVVFSTWHMRRFLTKIDGTYQAKHHQAYFFYSQLLRKKKHSIDGFTLEGALGVIRARFQGNKATKCTFFFIFPF